MTDLHVHTLYCDGKNSPEEMAKAAISRGVTRLGIVAHSFVPFDSCCIKKEDIGKFQAEVRSLKEKYRGKIEIYCGVELDYYSPLGKEGFDYAIGSVHYLKQGGEYFPIDDTPEKLSDLIGRFYGGDAIACAEDYFKTVSRLKEKSPDVIGHFDLIKKFTKTVPIDEKDKRYIAAWQAAALELIGTPFEVNTGGISRGYLSEPYPSAEMRGFIEAHGGRLVLSSDAHRCEDIAAGFERWPQYIR